jgi:hypothetical protein
LVRSCGELEKRLADSQKRREHQSIDPEVFVADSDLDDVLTAIRDVKHAVESKTTTAGAIAWVLIAMLVWSWLGSGWHSKFRYSIQYGVDVIKITVQDEPHDCNFLAAPLGAKYCRYERDVRVTRWAMGRQSNGPIISYDDGKSWQAFTPPENATVPEHSTAEEVYVGWEKKYD